MPDKAKPSADKLLMIAMAEQRIRDIAALVAEVDGTAAKMERRRADLSKQMTEAEVCLKYANKLPDDWKA